MPQIRANHEVQVPIPVDQDQCAVVCQATTSLVGLKSVTISFPALSTICEAPSSVVSPCSPAGLCTYKDDVQTFLCNNPPPASAITNSSAVAALTTTSAISSAALTTSIEISSSSVPSPTTSVTGSVSSAASQSAAAKTSSATPKPTSAQSSGLKGGAAAGLAIGCLIAGAAIAALIFFLLFKRYKKRHQAASSGYTHDLGPYNGAIAPAHVEKAVPIATTTPISPIDALLPQPAEDDAISGELSQIRDKIKNHAQTFYHAAAVDPAMVDESELQDVAHAMGMRSMTLCNRLLDPQTRIATIRLFLSYAILSRCGGQGDARASLLPPEVGLFVDALAGTGDSNAGQLALKSKWHAISSTLLASRYNSNTISDSDPRSHGIAATITAIDGVLRPFVASHQDDTQRLRNLQGVVQRAASFAFLLFSQPSTFKFQWSSHGQLAVFPALLQTSDENAHVLNPPRVFVDMEVV